MALKMYALTEISCGTDHLSQSVMLSNTVLRFPKVCMDLQYLSYRIIVRGALKVIPLKLFYNQTFVETWLS